MAATLPTTENTLARPWGLGKSGSGIRPGFSQTSDKLPPADEQWSNYYSNVMRGSDDGPWFSEGYTTALDYSRTYSDPSSIGEKPPEITWSGVDGTTYRGGEGLPWGGFRPTIASPGSGNGLNPSAISGLDLSPVDFLGAEATGKNGSLESPSAGSLSQHSCVDGSGPSPNYLAGYSGYSNPSGT